MTTDPYSGDTPPGKQPHSLGHVWPPGTFGLSTVHGRWHKAFKQQPLRLLLDGELFEGHVIAFCDLPDDGYVTAYGKEPDGFSAKYAGSVQVLLLSEESKRDLEIKEMQQHIDELTKEIDAASSNLLQLSGFRNRAMAELRKLEEVE